MRINPISEADKKRGRRAAWIGSASAALVSFLVLGVLYYALLGVLTKEFLLVAVYYCPTLALSAWISVWFCWKLMMWRGETKVRGFVFGTIAGFLTIFVTSFIVITGVEVDNSFQDGVLTYLLSIDTIYSIVIATLITTLFMLFFGGFLAPFIGAITGYMITKDPA